jgi:uncharacterized membrane protein (DUF485 family)
VPGEAGRAQRGSALGWDFDGELPSSRTPTQETHEDLATLHERVQAAPEFRTLRRRMRGFTFPMAAAFLLWYLAYVLLASYARGLMATPVLGGINLGLVIGLAQFATTFGLTAGYVRYAERRLDPLAAQIRDRVEEAVDARAARPVSAPAGWPVAAPFSAAVDMPVRQRVADGVDAAVGSAR